MKLKKGDRVGYRYRGTGEPVEATVSYVSSKPGHCYIATDTGDRLLVPNYELTKL